MGEGEAVVNAGVLIGAAKTLPDGGAYAVIPENARLENLIPYMLAPPYVRAEVKARTTDALIAYMNRHKTPASAMFADVDAGSVSGIVDYHSAKNDAAHASHRAVYMAPASEEWRVWTGADGKKTGQTEFARFIEENRVDIVVPDGAAVLEIARTLDARKKVSFKSGVRLEDGTYDLAYSEETTSVGGGIAGKVHIPSEIEIGIPVFYGGPRYRMTAFFRYRIEEGRLMMWVDLHRKKHVRDAAFAEIVTAVRSGCADVPVYEAAI